MKRFIVGILAIAALFSSSVEAKEDIIFVGFDAGRSYYINDQYDTKASVTVLSALVGQRFDNNVYVFASAVQYEPMNLSDAKTKSTYNVSGLNFGVGKELPVYGIFSTSADISLTNLREKRETTSLSDVNASPELDEIRKYSFGVGLNFNFNLMDKTKAALRLQGSNTEHIGFRNLMFSMKFDI